MNISTVRLIVPLLCGLLVLAVPSGNAKEPKPSPRPKNSEKVTTANSTRSNTLRSAASPTPAANTRASSVNGTRSTAKPKATPNPDIVGIDYRPGGDAKQKYKAKAPPTPKAK